MVRQYKGSDVHGTHLAVYSGCRIKANHVEKYEHKGGPARNGVNLYWVKFNPRQNPKTGYKPTNPYCPSVRAIPLEHIPLIVEGSNIFPARSRGSPLRG